MALLLWDQKHLIMRAGQMLTVWDPPTFGRLTPNEVVKCFWLRSVLPQPQFTVTLMLWPDRGTCRN